MYIGVSNYQLQEDQFGPLTLLSKYMFINFNFSVDLYR